MYKDCIQALSRSHQGLAGLVIQPSLLRSSLLNMTHPWAQVIGSAFYLGAAAALGPLEAFAPQLAQF